MDISELRAAVERARKRRNWTRPRAAEASGYIIQAETWRGFERSTQPLSPKVIEAVAVAFGWPMSWPDELPADDDLRPQVANLRDLAEQVRQLAVAQEELAQVVSELIRAVRQGATSSSESRTRAD